MAVTTPPTLTLPGLSPDRSDRTTFSARSIARDDYIKNTQVPQLTLALANVFANATDAATTSGASATSAAAALTSQTAAGLSAASAATNQASVQTLTGQFNILYLGAKSADPTLDNAGAALVNGAFYTSTTSGNIRAYTIAGGWVTGISAVAGVSTVNGASGAVVNIATTGANTFTGAQNHATGAAIASAATLNLDTATGNRVHVTGVATITAVTLTRGPRTVIFDGVLTLTHNATTNNLPGAVNITTAVGDRAIYESDGTTVYCVAYTRSNGTGVVSAGAGDHEIKVRTGNGAGSTSTKWRRFTTTENSIGTAITYADSATAGATFTIAANQGGLYQIIYGDVGLSGGGYNMGISVNSNQGTTSYFSITAAHRRTQSLSTGGFQGACGGVFSLNAGDIVRAHIGDSAVETASIDAFLYIRKVGNL